MCEPDKPYVLVVDDTPSNLEVIAATVRMLGYAVDTASTAGETITLIDERCSAGKPCYDAAVIDIDLPDVLGTRLGAWIRRAYPRLPFVFLTAYGRLPALVDETETRLQSPLVSKPITPEELDRKLREVIAKSKEAVPGERRDAGRENETGYNRRATDRAVEVPEDARLHISDVEASRAARRLSDGAAGGE